MTNKKRDMARHNNDNKYRENSKKRLITNVEKKFKTTMIGALASFEKHFGWLWAHEESIEPHEEMYDEDYKELWEQVRNDILNNGNSQLRAAQEEIAEYTMTWNRYHIDFLVTQDMEEDFDE